jgi:hypothetical protein
VTELRAALLQKEQLNQLRDQAYNELLNLIAGHTSAKNDKALITKLRDLKLRHSEIISSMNGGL